MAVVLYASVPNPSVVDPRKFTNRIGNLWIGDCAPPVIGMQRALSNISVGGQRPAKFNNPIKFVNGAVGAPATQTWKVSTDVPTPGSIASLPIFLFFGTTARRIEFQVVVQVGNVYTSVVTAMKALLDSVLNGTGVTANAFVKGFSRDESITDVTAAMVGIFGAVPGTAFVNDGAGTITLTVGANGANGNNLQMGGGFLNALPSPLLGEDANGAPQESGMFCPGDFTQFNLANPTATVAYTPGNLGISVVTPTVGTVSLDSGCYFNVSPEVLALLQGSMARSNNGTDEFLFYNAGSSGDVSKGKRVIFTFENDFGGYDRVDIYKCLFTDLSQVYAIDKADAIPLKANPQAIAGRVDKFGYSRIRY